MLLPHVCVGTTSLPMDPDRVARPGQSLTFEILRVIREAQGQHGLKHGDYQRYGSYCRRRIKRLRKSLNFVQASSSRARSNFLKKKVTSEAVCDAAKNKKEPMRYLLIVLMSSERCWSHAMALKEESNTDHRKKFHLLRKLEKAALYARVLHNICSNSICDARSKLESESYLYFMRGMLLFERQKWKQSANYLSRAQAIYTKLGQAISDEEVALVYRQRVEEMQPTLRYCAFSLGEEYSGKIDLAAQPDNYLASKLDQLILQTQEKQAATMQEVMWLGTKIAVPDEKVRTFLLMLQDKSGLKINELERLLFECRECIQTVKEKGKLHCYLQYLRHDLTCQRNQVVIDSLSNPSEMIRPYEAMIASTEDIKCLPLQQQFDNQNEINLLFEKLDAEITAFKAFRCYCIARSGKIGWKESIALLHRSSLYAREAIEHHRTDETLSNRLNDLVKQAESDKYAIYSYGLMADEEKEKLEDASRPLSEILDSKRDQQEVASPQMPFSSSLKVIPCKPLFFDLAMNHVELPDLSAEMNTGTRGGLTGFVKGLWGGFGSK